MTGYNFNDAIIDIASTFFLFPFTWNGNIIPDLKDWEALPLDIPTNNATIKKGSWNRKKDYAQYIYFHDYVRSFLFQIKPGSGNDESKLSKDSVRCYKFIGLTKPAIIELETYDSTKLCAILNNTYLHIFPGQVGILTFVTGNKIKTGDEQSDKNNELILVNNYKNTQRIIQEGKDLLLFNNMFRRIYPAYFEKQNFDEQIKNNEFPKSIQIKTLHGKPLGILAGLKNYSIEDTHFQRDASGKFYPNLTPLISQFLDPLFVDNTGLIDGEKCMKYTPVLDDRMLVHTYVAFKEGNQFKELRGQNLEKNKESWNVYFSYLMYVDNPEKNNTYRYDKEFIENLLKEHTYPRWEHFHSKTGFSRYSSAFQYASHWEPNYRNFESMYYQMFLLVIFYRAKLIKFSSEIAVIAENFSHATDADGRKQKNFKNDLRSLHQQFIKFMNIFWFREVSSQDQGIELFELMRKAFQLDPMFDQVKDEIERADDLLELLHNEKIEDFTQKAGIIGILIGILAIALAYFALDFEKIGGLIGQSSFSIIGLVLTFAFFCVLFLVFDDKLKIRVKSLIKWIKNKMGGCA